MSKSVSVLFRRVSPELLQAAKVLLPTAAGFDSAVASPEDVLRLALDIGLSVLEREADRPPLELADMAAQAITHKVVKARKEIE
jgi:hypothetical protein